MEYIVKTPIKFNKKIYRQGDIIDISDDMTPELSDFLETIKHVDLENIPNDKIVDTIESLNVIQLKELAKEEGISLQGCRTKIMMVEKIKEDLLSQAELIEPPIIEENEQGESNV